MASSDDLVRLAVPEALREPPPRSVPAALLKSVESDRLAMSFWGGVALSCVGGAYLVIFLALAAPWQIVLGAAVVAVTGFALLAGALVARARLRSLLRDGLLVEGEVVAVEAPRMGPLGGVRPASVRYRYPAPDGGEGRGRSVVAREGLGERLAVGSALPCACTRP